jgi:hypothetical protein
MSSPVDVDELAAQLVARVCQTAFGASGQAFLASGYTFAPRFGWWTGGYHPGLPASGAPSGAWAPDSLGADVVVGHGTRDTAVLEFADKVEGLLEAALRSNEEALAAALRSQETAAQVEREAAPRLPRWFVPAVRPGSQPRTVTMGELGQQTARTMAEIVRGQTAAVVTRHGQSIAVIIPIEPGSVEREAFAALGRSFDEGMPDRLGADVEFVDEDDLDDYITSIGGNPALPESTDD